MSQRMLLSPTRSDQARQGAQRETATPTDCGKVPYPNPLSAWRAIRAPTRKKRYKRCTAYPCPVCHQWHVTTKGRHDYPADWSRRRLALIERETRV